MKRYAILLLILLSITTNAQFNKTTLVYGSADIMLGNYLGITANINYVHKDKYSLAVGYSGFIRATEHAPSDYDSGLFFRAHDRLGDYHILISKLNYINRKKNIRTDIALGLGYLIIREPINWRIEGDNYNRYYNYDYGQIHAVSLIINPKMEFLFTNFFGMYVSPTLMLNKDTRYFGLGIGQLFRIIKNRNLAKANLF